MGFRSGGSIVQNAQRHANQEVVVRIDLKDFFPTITFRRVKGVFANLGYNEGVATVLALLITAPPRLEAEFEGQRLFVAIGDRRLPQGGCASPALTNIICRTLDARLAGVARSLGFRYTRYADDLIFSHSNHDAGIGALLTTVRRIVRAEGFDVNEDKTRILRPKHRQIVTGLVVNSADQPRVPRVAMRRFRAMIHHVERDGRGVVTAQLGQNAQAYAAGFLAFVYQVDSGRAAAIRHEHSWVRRPPTSHEPNS
jgi:hypothetical protein